MQLFGASAALATSGVSLAAAATGSKPILSLDAIPIAWPVYHRLEAFGRMPQAGEPVVLERDVPHPSGERGIAVYLGTGEKIGHITNQHKAALDWALQRAGTVEAHIAAVDTAVVNRKAVPGWGAFRIDVAIHEGIGLV